MVSRGIQTPGGKQRRRRMLRFAAGIIALLVMSNLPQARLPLMLVGLEDFITSLTYVSSDGQFDNVEAQAKGRTFEGVVARFAERKQRVGLGDLILCGPTQTNVNDFRVILVDP